MEIVFAGICCWVDSPPPRTGKTVIIRNASEGGTHRSIEVPRHDAFIHVKRGQADATNWTHDWTGSEDNLLFYFGGDYVTFDPPSSGGEIDLSLVPHVLGAEDAVPICPAADEIRVGFLKQPHVTNVLALVHVPADADVHGEVNQKNAVFVTMNIPTAPVTIAATPFDGKGNVRSLTVTDPDARVFIANVTMSEYLTGEGTTDDIHQYLVCEIFKARVPSASGQAIMRSSAACAEEHEDEPLLARASLDYISLSMLRRARNRRMSDFLDTLAAGCSDSQWP